MNFTTMRCVVVAAVLLAAAVPARADEHYEFNFAFGESCS
jgi:hypothetical protein